MKKVMMLIAMLGLAGSAYAAGWSGATQFSDQFGDLAVKAAKIQTSTYANGDLFYPDAAAYAAAASPIKWVTIRGGKYLMGPRKAPRG